MSQDVLGEQLRDLAMNLASRWNGGGAMLDRLVEATGDMTDSPFAALQTLGQEGVARVFESHEDRRAVEDAHDEMVRYMEASTWFDRSRSGNQDLESLASHPVAYVCMEFGLASWLPIYSGGLGILAGDMLKEASDMGLPMVAVGLFYRHGFFHQKLDESRRQTEIIPTVDPRWLPLVAATDDEGREIIVEVPLADRSVSVKVWTLQVGRVSLVLLDTNISANERPEDRAITDSLYGGDATVRIQQEILLGMGAVRALRRMDIFPSIYSMNEGHAAFLGLELIEEALPHTDLAGALAETRPRIVYTNHTVVPAGNDAFPRDLVRQYLAQFATESGLTIDQIVALGTSGDHDPFQMALLAFALSGKANAVSELHAQIIPREWAGVTVEAVTNGVHVPTWLGTDMRALIHKYIPDWQSDRPTWGNVRHIPNAELQQARDSQRRALVEFVASRVPGLDLDPAALTIVWARRFAEYKRAWLITSDIERLRRILTSAERPVQIIIAGKAHPRDDDGKRIMQELVRCIDSDTLLAHRMVFVEDYDEQIARYLTSGADVWLNTPRKPLEASGTSGMKSSDNGGLQLTVTDGWAAEVNWWNVGWGIHGINDAEDSRELYDFLETSVVPTFYNRDEHGVARGWAEMMKNTMHITLSRYSTRRMLCDYIEKLYRPLIQEQSRDIRATEGR